MRDVYFKTVMKVVESNAMGEIVDGSPDERERIADQALTMGAELCRAVANVLYVTEPGARSSFQALRDAEVELRSIVAWDGKDLPAGIKLPAECQECNASGDTCELCRYREQWGTK